MQWIGHILRMGKDRQLKQTIFEMFNRRREGDMLMDAPQTESWWDLCHMLICYRQEVLESKSEGDETA